jgi:hypothetical protein
MSIKKPVDFKDAASRRALDRQFSSTKLQAYRDKRISEHKFKGKYYGPDRFKGDLTSLKTWRAAGSPKNLKDFVKRPPAEPRTGPGNSYSDWLANEKALNDPSRKKIPIDVPKQRHLLG